MTANDAGCTCGFPDCMRLIHDREAIRNSDDPDVTRIVRRVGAALNSGRDAAVVAVVLDEVARAAEQNTVALAALQRLHAKVFDPIQMTLNGPMIGRIKVAGWIEREMGELS